MNNIYNQIKDKFIDIKINQKVVDNYANKYDLSKYYEIGELIEQLLIYNTYTMKELSNKLSHDLGYSISRRTLFYIQKFYQYQRVHPVGALLSWTHYRILMSLEDNNEIDYYIEKCIKNSLSKRKLQELIKTDEYHRLPKETINKIINKEELTILDEVKNPIIIRFDGIDINDIDERTLHKNIVLYMKDFLKQLGDGYSYIDDEYPIRLNNTYNYIDLLLFNIKYNCYVVVELKVTELTKDHIGQIQIYMNYIDQNIKNINHNKTIGLIIVKKNNEYYLKYSSDPRIKSIKWTSF